MHASLGAALAHLLESAEGVQNSVAAEHLSFALQTISKRRDISARSSDLSGNLPGDLRFSGPSARCPVAALPTAAPLSHRLGSKIAPEQVFCNRRIRIEGPGPEAQA